MKLFVLFISFFICVEFVSAQTPAIDSIDNLISKASSDTAKINLVIKKLSLLGRINIDSGIILGQRTLKEAQKIKYYSGEIKIRLDLSKNYCFKGDYKAAAANLKYLERFIKPSKDSTDFAGVYATNGMLYGMQTRYDSAIFFYEKAIGINERADNKKALALNYSNIAISYQQQSNFSQALFYQQKALKIAEEQNDEVSMAYTYLNMGITYEYLDDSSREEQAYIKAAELAKRNGLTNVELYVYSNLSVLYNEKDWQKTYDYAMKAAKLAEVTGDQGAEAESLSKAAIALAYTNKFDSALLIAGKSLRIADSSEQPLNIFEAYLSLGTIFKLKGNCKEAIKNFEMSILSLKDADIYTSANGDLYKELSECYEKTGNHIKALQLYKTYAQITDSVRSRNNIQKATELTLNYEFNKKQEAATAEQERKDAVANAKQLALLIGLAFCLALAIILIIGLKNKHRANFLLKKQKAEIQTTLTQLKATQTQLVQTEKLASLGELTAGIAHEIQNPLNFVNNFSEVNNELIDELQEEADKGNIDAIKIIATDIKENEQKIIHHGKRADAIVKSMLQHSKQTKGVKEPTDINALCNEYLRLSYHGLRAKDKNFNADFKTEFDKSIGKIDIVPQDIGRVLLNLYNNAFYTINEKAKLSANGYQPKVIVSTKKLSDKVEIRIADNGNGIPQNIIDKIFHPFFTTKPTGQGTGLGLSLAYDIVCKEHNGAIKAESEEGEGSEFIIQLPVV